MNLFGKTTIIGLLLVFSMHLVAQDTESASTTSDTTGMLSPIGERYIRDYLFVPLRSGESSSHRIVHKGLKSGTYVNLLKTSEDGKYSLVRTSKNKEGWLPSQYLVEEPTAAIKLKEAQSLIQQLTSEAGPISERLVKAEELNRNLSNDLEKLKRENNNLRKELDHIKGLSSNVLKLDEAHKSLMKEFEVVKNKRDTLVIETQQLEEKLKSDEFLNGALAVIFGIIATLIIQYLTRTRRRSSEWA